MCCFQGFYALKRKLHSLWTITSTPSYQQWTELGCSFECQSPHHCVIRYFYFISLISCSDRFFLCVLFCLFFPGGKENVKLWRGLSALQWTLFCPFLLSPKLWKPPFIFPQVREYIFFSRFYVFLVCVHTYSPALVNIYFVILFYNLKNAYVIRWCWSLTKQLTLFVMKMTYCMLSCNVWAVWATLLSIWIKMASEVWLLSRFHSTYPILLSFYSSVNIFHV